MMALARFTSDSRLIPATAAKPGFFEVKPFSDSRDIPVPASMSGLSTENRILSASASMFNHSNDSRDIPVPAARVLGLQNFAFRTITNIREKRMHLGLQFETTTKRQGG